MTLVKKLLPYFIASILVIGFWLFETAVDNYAWSPTKEELAQITKALTTIFFFKSIFWLTIINAAIFIVQQLGKSRYKTVFLTVILNIAFYIQGSQLINKHCAYPYYVVFINQSVVEWGLHEPIKKAGYQIGPILTKNILDKKMPLRLYAIGGLADINYEPSAKTLQHILFDTSEHADFRAESFVTLESFKSTEANSILTNFKAHAKDSVDKNILDIVKAWSRSK